VYFRSIAAKTWTKIESEQAHETGLWTKTASKKDHAFRKGDVVMGSFKIDYFIHAANILLLAAYSVRDILWLRLFAVASAMIAMPYFLLQPTPLWAAFGWSVLFPR